MAKRKIIQIDEEKCNGCGLCIPNCPEGALQVIGGKLRLVSDLFCDGLGACIGHCPQEAIKIVEREAAEYDEAKVMENIVRQGEDVVRAHLRHLKEHNQEQYLRQAIDYLKKNKIDISIEDSVAKQEFHAAAHPKEQAGGGAGVSDSFRLKQWPLQIRLVPALAPYLNGAELLISADCVPFAYADFHKELLRGKILLVGCPKLDDTNAYADKFVQIFKNNKIKSVTYAHMEVPCCFGLTAIIKQAISDSGRGIPYKEAVISIKGERLK